MGVAPPRHGGKLGLWNWEEVSSHGTDTDDQDWVSGSCELAGEQAKLRTTALLTNIKIIIKSWGGHRKAHGYSLDPHYPWSRSWLHTSVAPKLRWWRQDVRGGVLAAGLGKNGDFRVRWEMLSLQNRAGRDKGRHLVSSLASRHRCRRDMHGTDLNTPHTWTLKMHALKIGGYNHFGKQSLHDLANISGP